MDTDKKQKHIYTCKKCAISFSRRTSLHHHQVNEHTKEICCRLCGKMVGIGSLLNIHLRTHSHSAAISSARQCKKKLLNSQKAKWKKHLLDYKERETLKCNDCGKLFLYRGSLLNHIQTCCGVKSLNKSTDSPQSGRTKTNEQVHLSSLVSKVKLTENFTSNPEFKSHTAHIQTLKTNQCSPETSETTKCSLCGLHCKSSHGLLLHSRSHVIGEDNFKCLRCTLVFTSRRGLMNHSRWHVTHADSGAMRRQLVIKSQKHVGERAIFKCSKCGLECKSSYGLIIHTRSHVQRSDLMCRKCGLECKSSHGLLIHARRHITENDIYKCHRCGLECKSSNGLLLHIRRHLAEKPSFKCRECGLQCASNLGLLLHFRKHRVGQRNNMEVKNAPVRPEYGNVYQCVECLKTFAHKQILKHHIALHSGFKMFKCKECGLRFSGKQHLLKHIACHQRSTAFKCKVCTASFYNLGGLNSHLNMHNDENCNRLTCNFCKFYFFGAATLQRHIEARHTNKQKLECSMCGAQFSKNAHLSQHLVIHDQQLKIAQENNEQDQQIKGAQEVSSITECRLCGVQCKSSHGLLLHSRRHTTAQGKFKCLKCGLECKSDHGLLRHSRIHTNEQRKFKCQKCGLGCKSGPELQLHSQKHVNKNNKLKCGECDMEFKSNHGLLIHSAKKHANEKANLKCSACGMECKSSHGLLIHSQWHNKEVEISRCTECGLECKSSHGLLLHSRIHNVSSSDTQHKERNVGSSPTTQDGYKCGECSTIITSKQMLVRHILSHAGLKMFDCKECHLRFAQKSHLQKHAESHTQNLPFKCAQCRTSYKLLSSLRNHMRMHSKFQHRTAVTCKYCKFLFTNSNVLQRHIRIRHTGKKEFPCNLCNAQFEQDLLLKQHTALHKCRANSNRHHSESDIAAIVQHVRVSETQRVFVCKLCKKSFTYHSSLKYHMANTHNQFCCGLCHLYVDSESLSKINVLSHKYVCISCQPEKGKAVYPPDSPIPSQLKNLSFSQLVVALLYKLVDKEVLQGEGWLKKPVDQQLEVIVELCGQIPAKNKKCSVEENMVANVKTLFALSVGEAATGILLQFRSVKEILLSIVAPM